MKISDAVGSVQVSPFLQGYDLEEGVKRSKEAVSDEEAAMKKVEEAQHSATQSTFRMMDSHNEMVKKSQELNKELAKKKAMERLAQKEAEENRELLAEMAVRNAERADLLEAASMSRQ